MLRAIDLMSWVFTNGPGDRGSIPGRVKPKTKKMVLDAALLNTQHYKVRIKSKVEQSGVSAPPAPQCGTYWKEGLRVSVDLGRQLFTLPLGKLLTPLSFLIWVK